MRKNFSTTGLNFVVKLFRRNFISLFSAFFTKNFSPTYLITLPQTVNHSLCVCNFWQHFVESKKFEKFCSVLPDRNFQKSPIWTLKFAKIAISRAQNRGNIATFSAIFHYFLPWLTLFITFLCDNFFKNWNL